MSHYGTKSDNKNTSGSETSKFAEKANLASLKLDVNELNIDKLKTVPDDLSKLGNVVKYVILKKDVYDELVKKLMLFRLMILEI